MPLIEKEMFFLEVFEEVVQLFSITLNFSSDIIIGFFVKAPLIPGVLLPLMGKAGLSVEDDSSRCKCF